MKAQKTPQLRTLLRFTVLYNSSTALRTKTFSRGVNLSYNFFSLCRIIIRIIVMRYNSVWQYQPRAGRNTQRHSTQRAGRIIWASKDTLKFSINMIQFLNEGKSHWLTIRPLKLLYPNSRSFVKVKMICVPALWIIVSSLWHLCKSETDLVCLLITCYYYPPD